MDSPISPLPDTQTPSHAAVLYLWENRTLFLGNTPLPLRKSSAAAHTFVICLEGQLRIKYPDSPEEIVTRSVLINAGYTPNIDYIVNKNLIIAAVYLDPIGQDLAALSYLMEETGNGMHINHRDESEIISALLNLRDRTPSSEDTYAALEKIIIPADLQGKPLKPIDPRIVKVVKLIKETVSENISVGDLAESVHLSPSRLCKLFSSELGIPIRRYRLWRRLFVCTIALAKGKTMLEGGLEAGFSSPAHCSKTYSTLVGLSPTAVITISKWFKLITPEDAVSRQK